MTGRALGEIRRAADHLLDARLAIGEAKRHLEASRATRADQLCEKIAEAIDQAEWLEYAMAGDLRADEVRVTDCRRIGGER